jgi:hypothetical protein
MKHLQLNQMENVQGGNQSPECLVVATEVMVATIETGVGALIGGLLSYTACSLLK